MSIGARAQQGRSQARARRRGGGRWLVWHAAAGGDRRRSECIYGYADRKLMVRVVGPLMGAQRARSCRAGAHWSELSCVHPPGDGGFGHHGRGMKCETKSFRSSRRYRVHICRTRISPYLWSLPARVAGEKSIRPPRQCWHCGLLGRHSWTSRPSIPPAETRSVFVAFGPR